MILLIFETYWYVWYLKNIPIFGTQNLLILWYLKNFDNWNALIMILETYGYFCCLEVLNLKSINTLNALITEKYWYLKNIDDWKALILKEYWYFWFWYLKIIDSFIYLKVIILLIPEMQFFWYLIRIDTFDI